MKKRVYAVAGLITLCSVLLVSLVLLSIATQNSDRFDRLYTPLLLLNTAGLCTLFVLIVLNIRRLASQLRQQQPGSRLAVRMVVLFVLLAATPVLVVYGFSLHFIRHGIDSWFDVRIKEALNDSLDLSRAALDLRMRELLKHTQQIAEQLTEANRPSPRLALDDLSVPSELDSPPVPPEFIDDLRRRNGVEELTLFSRKGRILATSSSTTDIVPNKPEESILLQVRQGSSYVGLDPIRDTALSVRVVVNVPEIDVMQNPRILQALYPISSRMNNLAESVESAFVTYHERAYLRDKLKISFLMTLTLALLFSILSAVWAAFISAHRLSEPILDLAKGTQAIARGDYKTELPVLSQDDMGFLVESFNEMMRKIARAQDETKQSRDQADEQRTYLEAVLTRLSSGVLTFDSDCILRTANPSACQILGVAIQALLNKPLSTLANDQAGAPANLFEAITRHLTEADDDWQEQIVFFGPAGRRVLMCRGTTLVGTVSHHSGHVLVFDDITALIQGQRDAAWSEVARRLAHEIKNPLTPIQLSTERLRHKYLKSMPPEQVELFDRLTNTIIQQVETMLSMVNAFSDFARPPQMQPESLNLNDTVAAVVDLYRNMDMKTEIRTHLAADLPLIEADSGRLRQVLNNIVKNALEASKEADSRSVIEVTTRRVNEAGADLIELMVKDQGRGISKEILDRIFEPYVTTKPKGTGLGLAIVKKIVEEHGGIVRMQNDANGGASVIIRLPVTMKDTTKIRERRAV